MSRTRQADDDANPYVAPTVELVPPPGAADGLIRRASLVFLFGIVGAGVGAVVGFFVIVGMMWADRAVNAGLTYPDPHAFVGLSLAAVGGVGGSLLGGVSGIRLALRR